ncbi:uncharacterized protein LOC123499332 [Portunus trituberculatus]|uniref:uncharacterized protein LOC123499332 n=1 Tax=Portunus trituberculatus TaxID=210409 RepID=UPI001E1CCC8A|nr:uncharacterized protein LOC123499332 [Portunus trituberculatus]
MFLVDSLVDTSNTTSTYVVPNSEQVNLVPTLCLSPDGFMKEEEMPCLTRLDLQVTDCKTVPSGEVTRLQQESSPQPSPGTSSSAEAGAPCHQKLPVRPTATRKRKRPSSVASDIDSCVETLQTYVNNINKKKNQRLLRLQAWETLWKQPTTNLYIQIKYGSCKKL